MKHVVMFSGGAGSWAAAKRVKAAMVEGDELVLLFADTLVEDLDLYRFLVQAADNVEAGALVVIMDGRTPWQVFEDERYIGNTRVDPCSHHLKRRLLDKWRDANCDPTNTIIYVGLGWYEPQRVERLKARVGQWRYEAPMADEPHLSPDDVLAWLRAEGIEPPRLYAAGFTHNNCGGFCVKAGHAQFARLLKFNRPYYLENENHEQRLRGLGINGTVLRDRSGGALKQLSLRAFRLRLEGNPDDYDANDVGGCGCAIDTEENDKPGIIWMIESETE